MTDSIQDISGCWNGKTQARLTIWTCMAPHLLCWVPLPLSNLEWSVEERSISSVTDVHAHGRCVNKGRKARSYGSFYVYEEQGSTSGRLGGCSSGGAAPTQFIKSVFELSLSWIRFNIPTALSSPLYCSILTPKSLHMTPREWGRPHLRT